MIDCKNVYTSSKFKDESGNKLLMCVYTKSPCTSQRYCGEEKAYIISEKADKFCKNYNK